MSIFDWFGDLLDAILGGVKNFFDEYIIGGFGWIAGNIAGIVMYARDGILDVLDDLKGTVFYLRDTILDALATLPEAVWNYMDTWLGDFVEDFYERRGEERG